MLLLNRFIINWNRGEEEEYFYQASSFNKKIIPRRGITNIPKMCSFLEALEEVGRGATAILPSSSTKEEQDPIQN